MNESLLSDDERARLLVELWKQTVTVQQHFNDLCWRIRGLAMTALTFSVGAAALAARERVTVRLAGMDLQLSLILTTAGLVLWRAFYYVDRRWYHQLLKGAVRHGEALEAELRHYVPVAGLTKAISEASPYRIGLFKWKRTVTSSGKLKLFYLVVSVLLVVFGIGLQLGGDAPAPTVEEAVIPGESP